MDPKPSDQQDQVPIFDYEDLMSSRYDTNIRTGKGKDNPCFLCGLFVDRLKSKQIHLCERGGLLGTSDENHPYSQGFFDIGPECAKKIPPQFLF